MARDIPLYVKIVDPRLPIPYMRFVEPYNLLTESSDIQVRYPRHNPLVTDAINRSAVRVAICRKCQRR